MRLLESFYVLKSIDRRIESTTDERYVTISKREFIFTLRDMIGILQYTRYIWNSS
jgi:hypothetical protein